ncbi:MAG: LacI family DNA-binding transcriptional regulator [Christensenellaceae bacterium]
MKKEISIKKISEVSGYSVATVSRVINGNGRYSKDTEEKVKGVIKQYNYVPNMIAKGLRTKQIPTIGIIVPDITNEFYARITLAVQNALFKESYSTFICTTNERKSLEKKHLELMRAHNISGVVFVCSEYDYDEEFFQKDLTKIYVDRVPELVSKQEDSYFISSDAYNGGRLAIRELVDAGCKRIIAILEKRDIYPKTERLAGVQDEFLAQGIDCSKAIHYIPNINYADACQTIKELLEQGERFDGIFCYTDIIATAAVRALHEHGISVPKAVKLVGFDDTSIATYCTPSITTIHQPMEEMGTLAAELMLKLLSKKEVVQKKYIIPVTLIKRGSTKK